MSTSAIPSTRIAQPRSWMRAAAVTLAGLAIAFSIGLEIQSSQSSDGPTIDSKATSFEPSAQARRLRALAEDRAQLQIERALRELRTNQPAFPR